jgi:hypothetical protein
MELTTYRTLSPRLRALIAVAVLLDGREAPVFLENDDRFGLELARAADELSRLTPDLRMALAGTLLRQALKELK